MATNAELIRKQVEFYFSDSNFPRDKFLRAQAAKDEKGFLPVEVLTTFNRLKRLNATAQVIADAVKGQSSFLEISEDGKMIRRTTPLPSDDTSLDRTLYAKGFPETVSIEEVEKVFSGDGNVKAVRLRRDKQLKKQKDSAFIEFATAEEAKAAAAKTYKFQDKELLLLMKADYIEKKKKEQEANPKVKGEKRKKAEEKKDQDNNNNNEEEQSKKKIKNDQEPSFIKGVIVKMNDLASGVTREIIKTTFESFGKVNFVEFDSTTGATEGFVRFAEPEAATKAVAEMKANQTSVGDSVPTLTVLEGEAEQDYWTKVRGARTHKRGRSKQGGRGGGRRGGGGRGGGGRGGGGRGGRRKKY